MTSLLEWLLDLEGIRLGRDAPLMLRWGNPIEPWIVFALGLVALAWIVLTYMRERLTPVRRVLLIVLRCALVALTFTVVAQPLLALQRNRVERSYVTLLVDRSLSMASSDTYHDSQLAESIARGAGVANVGSLRSQTRSSLATAALLRLDASPLRELQQRNGVHLATFAGAVESIGFYPAAGDLSALSAALRAVEPDGTTTDLAGAIGAVLAESSGRRLTAIVLVSDGQTTHPADLDDVLNIARDRKIPLYALRIGSPVVPRNLQITPPRHQDSVFVNDLLAIETKVSALGLTDTIHATIRLIDRDTDTVVASETVDLTPEQSTATVELHVRTDQPGTARYRVEVDALPDEELIDDNVEDFDVVVMDNHLRVLYVDGYPRYEYRYLKNALLREKTIELSVLLIEADERFVQEGTDSIRRFPQTPEELHRFDVVLFGDVDPLGGWLTSAQMNMLVDFVARDGGGFGLIAGPRAAPHRFVGTVLEKLIPVRIDSGRGVDRRALLTSGFRPTLTPEGRRSRVFRLAADRDASHALFSALPKLYWYARTNGPAPGASVLAQHAVGDGAMESLPIVVTGRYGAGRVFFQATDDTWRWRRHTGEFMHDTYWVRVVRELMRRARVAQDRRYLLATDRRTYPYGQPVRVQVDVYDARLLSRQQDVVTVAVSELRPPLRTTPPSGSDEPQESHAAKDVRTPIDKINLRRIGSDSVTFEGIWLAPRPGRYALEVAELARAEGARVPSVRIHIDRPNLEAQHPEADHDALARMALATGGKVIDLDQLESVFAGIADRSVMIPDDIVEPLWDSKLAFGLFVVMISMEWIFRKANGLL